MPLGSITDIDGYAINERKALVTGLLQKREYEINDYLLLQDGEKVKEAIFAQENEEEWKLRCKISNILDVPLYLFLWPIDYPIRTYAGITDPIITFKVYMKKGNVQFDLVFVGIINQMTSMFRRMRNKSFPWIKSLRAANTKMECYLAAKTDDPWPGNLDGITWDATKDEITSIIEFKTHNYPQYTIQNQFFGQWEGDERRYKVLDIMQKHFEAVSTKPKFIFAVWGTDMSHKEVKLQTIDDLKASNDKYIRRPIFTSITIDEFRDEFLSYIK